jgi:hypothetical protein
MKRLPLFVTVVLTTVLALGAAAQTRILVTEVSGVVERVDTSPDERLARGDWLPEGAEVRTGERSRLTLRVPGGSYLRLSGNSRIRLDNLGSPSGPTRGEFHVSRGLSAVVVATDLDQRFVVTTPTSSAAVRGTVFFVGVDEAKNLGWVCGLAGEVEVEISNQEETFAVTPNWGVWFEEGSGTIVAARELTEEERQSYYLLAGEDGVVGGLEAAEIEQRLERAYEDRGVIGGY